MIYCGIDLNRYHSKEQKRVKEQRLYVCISIAFDKEFQGSNVPTPGLTKRAEVVRLNKYRNLIEGFNVAGPITYKGRRTSTLIRIAASLSPGRFPFFLFSVGLFCGASVCQFIQAVLSSTVDRLISVLKGNFDFPFEYNISGNTVLI